MVRTITLAIILCVLGALLHASSLNGNDNDAGPETATLSKLTKRIAELEGRMAQFEERLRVLPLQLRQLADALHSSEPQRRNQSRRVLNGVEYSFIPVSIGNE